MPKSTAPISPSGLDETGTDRLVEKGEDEPPGDGRQIVAGGAQALDIGDLVPVDPFDGQHPAIGAIPVDGGQRIALEAAHRLGQLGGRGGLAPQVQLAVGPALEVGNGEARPQARGLAAKRFEMGRGPFVSDNVLGKALADTRTQHLDRHHAPVRGDALVHLRDRGRTHRHRVDFGEQALDRPLETALDLRPDLGKGHWRQAVLQREQVAGGVFADNVGPRGERLAELDRRRADRPERGGIVRLPGLTRAKPGETHESAHRRRRVGLALDPAQRAVPGERAPPAQQPPDVSGRSGQIFHPEWIATSPPMMGSTLTCSKPASPIIVANAPIGGKRRIDSIR